MTRMDQVFKAYDVRGTVPDQLDAEMCQAIGRAMARFAQAPEILMARDMRASGVELATAFSDGVRAEGVAVTDLGMGSTDFLYFAAGHLDAPGAMFTASHNPARYNGIKLCLSGARPIGRDTGLAEIEAIAEGLLGQPLGELTAPRRELNLLDEWAGHVISFVDTASLRPLRVVADTANGMGGLVVPIVFDTLPFSVEILFPELDGNFPNHPADPSQPENLVDLKAAVLAAESADDLEGGTVEERRVHQIGAAAQAARPFASRSRPGRGSGRVPGDHHEMRRIMTRAAQFATPGRRRGAA